MTTSGFLWWWVLGGRESDVGQLGQGLQGQKYCYQKVCCHQSLDRWAALAHEEGYPDDVDIKLWLVPAGWV